MDKVKCECGHANPYGTVICESCGKPLEGDSTGLLNMRYEGVARRSQTYNRTIIDKIWNFFSSVKVGVWIIILTLVASSLGTIFPQQMYIPPTANPAVYYQETHGFLGQMYYQLGFHNLYSSWWYMILIASLGISLLIASIDRVVPLYRALKKQRVTRHESFMKRQRLYGVSDVQNQEETMEKAKQILKEKKYNVSEENGNVVAEKGRFSRWGPYVNHLGLIIFLIGCMLRFFPGMYVDEFVWVREGDTVVIPGTDGQYFIENEEFILEVYDEEDEVFGEALQRSGVPVAQTFKTRAVVYERMESTVVGEEAELKEIARHNIIVNDPMKFADFALYQVDFKLNELNQMAFTLDHKESGDTFGQFTVDLYNPLDEYDLGDGYKVRVLDYFQDYFFDEAGNPATRSKIPNNPAFIFEMITPDKPKGEVSFIAIQRNLEPFGENDYRISFAGIDTKNVTALTVRKDHTLGFLMVGGAIFMIGLVQGSYWSHRRIWIQQRNGQIMMAGHANKMWASLKKDIEAVVEQTELTMPIDQVEEKEKEETAPKEETM
ncbi:cytochrome c biogenesis protein ResB [Alkalihalobacillus sp. LMS39]|uniref:cytochrome c biogenesis protein ResB n=1 Tax=Alkalihalobacillus sp. LMS39 TaxID=2924032 RepID=UPI001FB56A0D|nr:cytochrome c biogenesis protein ResB [Alkalihalobacillus sp. LMS39]UOE92414.1 cytochrome c biogenesis protein ResB [Alkalihalobacillus sp. LMS39]